MKTFDWIRRSYLKEDLGLSCESSSIACPSQMAAQLLSLDELALRRLRPELLDRETALEQAKKLARAERDKLND